MRTTTLLGYPKKVVFTSVLRTLNDKILSTDTYLVRSEIHNWHIIKILYFKYGKARRNWIRHTL